MNQTPAAHHMHVAQVAGYLADRHNTSFSIDELAIHTNITPADVRRALHTLCNEKHAHLVRPAGDFAYKFGPPPPKPQEQA